MTSTFLLLLLCPALQLQGFAPTLTTTDKQAIEAATANCPRLYRDSPCLVKMIKRADRNYWAICGKTKQ